MSSIKLRILLGLALLSFSTMITKNAYCQKSIGESQPEIKKPQTDAIDIRIDQWAGKKFIILEMGKSLQKSGYVDLSRDAGGMFFIKYQTFVGKTITAEDVKETSPDHYLVKFGLDNSDTKIYSNAFYGNVGEIALVDDLELAKKEWVGKTVYSKLRQIKTYDADKDKSGEIEVNIGDPLKVLDVWWRCMLGTDRGVGKPLWLIVETKDGKRGYIRTGYSWTNTPTDQWTQNRPWSDDFFDFNPKEKFKWTDDIWQTINEGKAKVGMTKDMVILSWGKPEKINKTIYQNTASEQWVYGNQYLYFDGNKLTAIQSY